MGWEIMRVSRAAEEDCPAGKKGLYRRNAEEKTAKAFGT